MLVIACNSASAAVLHDARERYEVPVVEVIRPAVRRAVAATRNDHVGVISTVATKTSRAYEDAFAAAPQIEVTTQACPRFVEFVEQGVTGGQELLDVAHEYLDPVARAGVDTLILGCTHYPLLTGVVSYVMGDGVTLVSSADETAKDVYRTLVAERLERPDRPARAGPPVPHDRGSPPVPRLEPAIPRAGGRRRGEGGLTRAAHGGRLLRLVPRAGQRGVLLPRRGGRVPHAARPRQRRAGQPAAVRRPRRPRRGPRQPPAPRPLHRPPAAVRGAHLRPAPPLRPAARRGPRWRCRAPGACLRAGGAAGSGRVVRLRRVDGGQLAGSVR